MSNKLDSPTRKEEGRSHRPSSSLSHGSAGSTTWVPLKGERGKRGKGNTNGREANRYRTKRGQPRSYISSFGQSLGEGGRERREKVRYPSTPRGTGDPALFPPYLLPLFRSRPVTRTGEGRKKEKRKKEDTASSILD